MRINNGASVEDYYSLNLTRGCILLKKNLLQCLSCGHNRAETGATVLDLIFALSHPSSSTCNPKCKGALCDATGNELKTSRSDWTISPPTFPTFGICCRPIPNASVCHTDPEPLSHDFRVDPTFPSSTLQSRQSSVPLRLFAWQLP